MNIYDDPPKLIINLEEINRDAFFRNVKNTDNWESFLKGKNLNTRNDFIKLLKWVELNKDKITIDDYGQIMVENNDLISLYGGHKSAQLMNKYLTAIANSQLSKLKEESVDTTFDKNKHGFDVFWNEEAMNSYVEYNKKEDRKNNSKAPIFGLNDGDKTTILNKYKDWLRNKNIQNVLGIDNLFADNYDGARTRETLGFSADLNNFVTVNDELRKTIEMFEVLDDSVLDEWMKKRNERKDDINTGNTVEGIMDDLKWKLYNNILNNNLNNFTVEFDNGLKATIKNITLNGNKYTGTVEYDVLDTKFKSGGILKALNGAVSPNTSDIKWKDLVDLTEFEQFLRGISLGDLNYLNLLLDRHKKLSVESNSDGKIPYNLGVFDYQTEFNNVAPLFNAIFTSDKLSVDSKNQTSDNAKNNWKADGIYGVYTKLRHFGNEKNDAIATKINDILNPRGINYEWDEANLVYYFKPILLESSQTSLVTLSNDKSDNGNTDNGNIGLATLSDDSRNMYDLKVEPVKNSEFLSYAGDTIRYFRNALANKRIHDIANKETPFFQQLPPEESAIVREDLRVLELAQKAKGLLQDKAVQNSTRDASLNNATMLEATAKGEQLGLQAKTISDQKYDQTIDKAIAVNNKNRLAAYQVANDNALAAYKTEANKRAYDMAYENKQATDFDVYVRGLLENITKNLDKKEALRYEAEARAIKNVVTNNPESVIQNLTEEEANAWRQGNQYGKYTLDQETKKLYDSAYSKIINFYNLKISELQGVLNMDKYSKFMQLENPEVENPSESYSPPTIEFRKSGGVVKERIANADRFYKSIKNLLQLAERSLDRLFKCLYNVKNKK